jgi:hypothetical protein
MTAITFISIAILIAAFVTLVVPGGVFVVPVLLVAAAIWGGVRFAASRRDGTAAGPR